ncbi:MAG: hypothetical protein RL030_2361 [Pseudomonadota bacterium]
MIQSALPDREPDVTLSFSKSVTEDPAVLHSRLRQTCPVALQKSDGGPLQNGWLVTRYEDIVAVARDTDTFSQPVRWPGRRRPPLESDPPEHRQFRALLQPFFVGRAVAQLEPISRGLAAGLVAPIVSAGGGDLAREFARPLPPQVLLARLGQSTDGWERIKECCEASYLQGSTDAADLKTYEAADAYLWDYCHAALADRKATPRDPEQDLIAALLAGQIDGKPVEESLVAGMLRLLLAAGHDSTTSAIGICLRYLAEHPQVQEKLRAQPEDIALAIEEILRLQAPVIQMARLVTRDVVLGGRQLRAGDRVLLVFASGNRDESRFGSPEQCQLDRFPNRHLSFGTGIHACIGNALARQEILVALEELLARTQEFGLASEPEREFWHPYGATRLHCWVKRRA